MNKHILRIIQLPTILLFPIVYVAGYWVNPPGTKVERTPPRRAVREVWDAWLDAFWKDSPCSKK